MHCKPSAVCFVLGNLLIVLIFGIYLLVSRYSSHSLRAAYKDSDTNSSATVSHEIEGGGATVQCRLFLVDDVPELGRDLQLIDHSDVWVCVDLMDGTEYSLEGLPENFFEENKVRSGHTILTITASSLEQIVESQPSLEENLVEEPSSSNLISDGDGGNTSASDEFSNYISPVQQVGNATDEQGVGVTPIVHTENNTISLSPNTTMEMPGKEWEPKLEGTASILVVRVTDGNGVEPTLAADEISDYVFGTDGDRVNLRSQYLACSGGKLDFVPASGKNIMDGVVEVSIEQHLRGVDRVQAQQWVTAVVPAFLGEGHFELDYDYTMYVMPPGVDFRGAGAYAAVGGRRSVYNDFNIAILMIQMHEVGHSLGLRHSGYQGNSYGDKTCFEGFVMRNANAPAMCFNGAKSWYLGWYNDTKKQGHQLIHPIEQGGWSGKLVGVDAYLHNDNYRDDDYKVVVKVETTDEDTVMFPDLYIMYNRKEGVNGQVQAFGDTITVVSQSEEFGTQSWLNATLIDEEGSDAFRVENFDNSGLDLVIQVCQVIFEYPMPDYAGIIIYLDDGKRQLECESALPSLPMIDWD